MPVTEDVCIWHVSSTVSLN